MLRSALLGGAPRGPSPPLPSPPRPCKSRRSMGLSSSGNERALSLSLSLSAESELFRGFYELCGCQVTVENINNLNLALHWPHPPAVPSPPNARLFQRAERRREGTFYNPEWHGKSNLMSVGAAREERAATVLKAAQIPPRLIQSLPPSPWSRAQSIVALGRIRPTLDSRRRNITKGSSRLAAPSERGKVFLMSA